MKSTKPYAVFLLILSLFFLAAAIFFLVSGDWLLGIIFLVLNFISSYITYRLKNKHYPETPVFPKKG